MTVLLLALSGSFLCILALRLAHLSLQLGVLFALQGRCAEIPLFFLFFETVKGLQEDFLSFLIQNLAQIDKLRRIFPLLISGKNMQREQLKDPYSSGEIFRGVCPTGGSDCPLFETVL